MTRTRWVSLPSSRSGGPEGRFGGGQLSLTLLRRAGLLSLR
jgi:hypothetical protein